MKTLLFILAITASFQAEAKSTRYSAAQKYITAKLSNPNISDSAKKAIITQAMKAARPKVLQLSGYERHAAETALKAVQAMNEHAQWGLIVETLQNLNLVLR